MADDEEEKSIKIFGREVSKIPCFRDSFLYGITSGCGGGVLHFLFTSKVKASTHVSMGLFTTVTLSYWFFCRYTHSLNSFNTGQMRALMRTGDTAYVESPTPLELDASTPMEQPMSTV